MPNGDEQYLGISNLYLCNIKIFIARLDNYLWQQLWIRRVWPCLKMNA